ncbi:Serine protease gd [Habropoda laboriosa]|uniref:Serine protease gd n=1 Tax=Habropoda laboriosa TaxID=597456 RepID=A0A0L7QUZ5_9HYME|nr:PREDICTED: serine protease gd-like [Habropoda laboriosa]KOC62369.1 Serine protease gd [Habropoda laboriosa]
MVGVIVKAALLVYLLKLISNVAGQQTPCPNYFRYVQDEETNNVIGFVEIPSPPKGISLHLSVGLSVAVALPSKYVGRLELAQSRDQSVKAVNQGRSLKYKIHFPLPRPVAILTGLWFNNQLICSGPRANGPIVTSIVLNHTLYPPGALPGLETEVNTIANYPTVENLPPQRPQPTKSQDPIYPNFPPVTIPIPTQRPRTNNEQDNQTCGRPTATSKINLLVVRGEKTSHGQWPWLAAIFIVKKNFEYQCAGTLVSNIHVITAAHCFQDGDIKLPAGTLTVSLGRYRLKNWREKGSVNREVAGYNLHPDYNASGNADADLAVLILRERVEYNVVIKPICLWSGPNSLSTVVGKVGHVVGWGRDESGNRNTEEPRQTAAPIVSQEDCLWSNTNFVSLTSNRTFCAGLKDETGPCNGDSGSGFVIHDSKTNRYYLRGVVSRSLLGVNMSCDLSQYVVYVDVAKHMDWIKQQISSA